jgi:hypothetical protein
MSHWFAQLPRIFTTVHLRGSITTTAIITKWQLKQVWNYFDTSWTLRCILLSIQIESIDADVQIKTEREWKDLIFYKSQLYLTSVTLKSPYTKLKCGYDTENSTVKEISFTIKGTRQRVSMQLPHTQQYYFHPIEINNDPVNNSINLEKGIAQILSCNRLSQHVPIHWLKVIF